jgi:hypothetical protein
MRSSGGAGLRVLRRDSIAIDSRHEAAGFAIADVYSTPVSAKTRAITASHRRDARLHGEPAAGTKPFDYERKRTEVRRQRAHQSLARLRMNEYRAGSRQVAGLPENG